VQFEWDENKNSENIRKHGIDFEDACKVFAVPILAALDTRQDYGEDRWIGLGFLEQRVIVIVYTYRDFDRIRVISMRKGLQHERIQFEKFLRNRLEAD
jgi:uncharacterized DUF497 family protein